MDHEVANTFGRYRLEGTCADVATIDLNSLLYKYEKDIAGAIGLVFGDKLEVPADCLPAGTSCTSQVQTSLEWLQKAERRKGQINKYLWDAKQSMYFDYNTRTRRQNAFETVTCLWALWSGVADYDQAALLGSEALPRFEEPGGLVSTTEQSSGRHVHDGHPQRQWDYPYGWAPHQIMAWEGLRRYGFDKHAARLAYRWLHSITKTAVNYNGMVVEKYDVTRELAQHEANAEYGNQGLKFEGLAREG